MTPALQDIMDIPSVQDMMDALYRITRIPSTLLDQAGDVLLTSGCPVLCEIFSGENLPAENCFLAETFRRQSGKSTTAAGWTEFLCASGLANFGTKLVANGQPVATLLVGPLLHESPAEAGCETRAQQIGFGKAAWLQRLNKVPVISGEALSDVLRFYADMSRILTDSSFRSVAQPEDSGKGESTGAEQHNLFTCGVHGVMIVSRQGKVLDADPAMSNLLGYSHADFLHSRLTEHARPPHDDRLRQSLRKVTGENQSHFKVPLLRRDGQEIPLELRAREISFDGCQAVQIQALDLDERMPPEYALRESEERFRSVFVDAGIGMALTSWDGRFVQVNPEFCRFLGYREDELLSRTMDEVTHPDDRLPSRRLRQEALEKKRSVINLEKRYLHRDGSVVWGRLTSVYRIGEAKTSHLSVAMVQDITAEKLAQEAVQASEATLKGILLAVPMSVGLVKNRVFCWVNRWMIEELGYAEDELIGKSARLLYESDEEFARVGREKYVQVRAGLMGEIQTRFRCNNGRVIDVLLRSTPIDPDNLDAGVIFTALNISELKQADMDLRKALDEAETARQQMNGILRSVIAGLMVIDLEGRISMVNPSVEALLDRKAATMIGRPVKQVVQFPDFLDKVELALAGAEQPDPVELMLRDDLFLQVKVTSVKNLQGVVRGAVAVLRDVSREHAINQMKDEFISAAAHELRTPMTSILGYTELMLEQLDDFDLDQIKSFLQVVFERSMSLSQIISDMLDLSRVQSGRLISLEKSPGSLVELARQIVSSYQYNESGCELVIRAEEDLPMMLFDARKMTQVFDNLLSNAVKFSPQGGRIGVHLRRDPGGVMVAVRDQGVGMSTQQVERIFDKFFRADYSNTAASGLGLGMTLVKSIIEGHGGKIWVESEAGKGTSVFFSLPIIQ